MNGRRPLLIYYRDDEGMPWIRSPRQVTHRKRSVGRMQGGDESAGTEAAGRPGQLAERPRMLELAASLA
jgi:hypothetical protein